MNLATRARILVVVFWAVGVPLVLLSFVAIPRALNPAAGASRVLWILVPVLGLAVASTCLGGLLRMSARAGGAVFERRWLGRYYLELLIAFVVYLALFTVAVKIVPTAQNPTVRTLAGLAPAVGLVLIFVAVVRLVRRADDYHRARLLLSFAVTAGVTSLWTSCYALLESLGFPRLNMFWIPLSMTVTWGAWSIGRALLGR
jgi:energy-converting hydrogenase Eha subunit E